MNIVKEEINRKSEVFIRILVKKKKHDNMEPNRRPRPAQQRKIFVHTHFCLKKARPSLTFKQQNSFGRNIN